MPDRFAQASLHTIPFHRPAQCAPHRKSHARPTCRRAPQIENCKVSGKMAFALLIYTIKISVPQ
jgi:hypothetical protein